MVKMYTKRHFVFLAAVFISFLFLSCKKEKVEEGIVISVAEPVENALFAVPGHLTVHVRVVSDTPLKFLKFNITGENFVPFFGDVTVRPGVNVFDKKIDFKMEAKNVDKTAAYYFHVFAQNENGEKNSYVRIYLKNRNKVLKGVVLFVKNGDGNTGLIYHRNDGDTLLAYLRGENLSSGFLTESNLLFALQTSNPVLAAYKLDGLIKQWDYSPQTVENQTCTAYDFAAGRVLTASTGGVIRSFDMISGVEKSTTRFMTDTVPLKMGVTRDYIFASCRTKLNGTLLWTVFYKNTGIKLFQRQVTGNVVEVFDNYEANMVVLIQNRDGKSFLVNYDASENIIVSQKTIVPEPLIAAVKTDAGTYVVATGTSLYLYSDDFLKVLDFDNTGTVSSLDFDDNDNLLFVLKNNGMTVLKLPSATVVDYVGFENEISGMQPVYNYQY